LWLHWGLNSLGFPSLNGKGLILPFGKGRKTPWVSFFRSSLFGHITGFGGFKAFQTWRGACGRPLYLGAEETPKKGASTFDDDFAFLGQIGLAKILLLRQNFPSYSHCLGVFTPLAFKFPRISLRGGLEKPSSRAF